MADIDVVQQDLALLKELEIAIRLLQIGCREVQNNDGTNTFYHLAMLTLANGFERFMKVIICLRIMRVPASIPLRRHGQTHGKAIICFICSKELSQTASQRTTS